jgi:hypothetical protein
MCNTPRALDFFVSLHHTIFERPAHFNFPALMRQAAESLLHAALRLCGSLAPLKTGVVMLRGRRPDRGGPFGVRRNSLGGLVMVLRRVPGRQALVRWSDRRGKRLGMQEAGDDSGVLMCRRFIF